MSWELCVIGTAVSDIGSMGAAEELRPSDFTGDNQAVWAEILALHSQNALSAPAVSTLLLSHDVFKTEADVMEYMQRAISYNGPTMDHYVEMVIDGSIKRSVQRVSGQIAMQARQENARAEELLEYAEHEIMKLRRHRNEGISMADLMGIYMPRLQSIRRGDFRPAWKPKTQGVQNIIKYAEETEMIVIGGRPGEGKSSYLRYEAYHHSKDRKGVLYFLIENDPIECARYFLALTTGIDSDLLKTGKLSEAQMEMIQRQGEDLHRRPIYIEYASTIDKLRHTARRYALENKVDLILLDYIQLVRNGIERREQDVSATSGGLKNLAMELKIPVLAAAQLSRNIETRGENSPPQLSDLRDSGSLEQDANIVIFPRSIWPSDPTDEQIGIFPENRGANGQVLANNIKVMPIKFFVEKNRNGSVGITDPVMWNRSTGNYRPMVNR